MTGLAQLNALPVPLAVQELGSCCGSTAWARRVASRRPFGDASELYAIADEVWWNLTPNDWLEAFRAHPRIGERVGEAPQSHEAKAWSDTEQSGVHAAPGAIRGVLAQANAEYHERFGYIFIVCATGKSGEEMLAMLRVRLGNDPDTELRVAAEEQSRITRLRLEKLLTRAVTNS
ncbi:MAG: 2-oxo-4-hydroxy-4-carboxy-5-ureidoimidazoline decarboxylase [Anaerolineae bacterium]|nr:2-oxo-4-hydroxy-4-carboxy-5-ureidoimidazoline decarboxylase [Gemmatimonadaceae bacterium]